MVGRADGVFIRLMMQAWRTHRAHPRLAGQPREPVRPVTGWIGGDLDKSNLPFLSYPNQPEPMKSTYADCCCLPRSSRRPAGAWSSSEEEGDEEDEAAALKPCHE